MDNLLSNAIKFSEPGTTITVIFESDRNWVFFRVADEGLGVPEDEFDKLFDSFSKTSVKPTGGETSTGLGLNICKKVMLAHGGNIFVENLPGKGAQFSVQIQKTAVSYFLMELEVVWNAGATLGEGPIWYDNRLYWVDIEEGRLHIYHPKEDSEETFSLPGKVGTVVPRKSGGLVLAGAFGFALFDPSAEKFTPLPNPPAETLAGRFNDGKCDPQGRLWAGTEASSNGVATGSLYRLDPDFQCEVIQTGIGCSNGLAWSHDHSTFYYIDSFKNRIEAYDFDPVSGSIENLRIIREEPLDDETPFFDGMTIDTEGRLWVARWAGNCVQCIDPASGEVLERIDVPVRKVTACWFGGDDLGDLYITCASRDETEEQLKEQPHAGALFRCRPGAKGIPAVPFAG